MLEALISVSVGAVLGFGTSLLTWKIGLREQERRTRLAVVSGLLAEIKDNLQLSTSSPSNHTLVPLITDLWQAHKGHIEFLVPEFQESIRKGYAAAFLANAIVQEDLFHLKYYQGYLESDYKKRVGEMADTFRKAEIGLGEWLKQHQL